LAESTSPLKRMFKKWTRKRDQKLYWRKAL